MGRSEPDTQGGAKHSRCNYFCFLCSRCQKQCYRQDLGKRLYQKSEPQPVAQVSGFCSVPSAEPWSTGTEGSNLNFWANWLHPHHFKSLYVPNRARFWGNEGAFLHGNRAALQPHPGKPRFPCARTHGPPDPRAPRGPSPRTAREGEGCNAPPGSPRPAVSPHELRRAEDRRRPQPLQAARDRAPRTRPRRKERRGRAAAAAAFRLDGPCRPPPRALATHRRQNEEKYKRLESRCTPPREPRRLPLGSGWRAGGAPSLPPPKLRHSPFPHPLRRSRRCRRFGPSPRGGASSAPPPPRWGRTAPPHPARLRDACPHPTDPCGRACEVNWCRTPSPQWWLPALRAQLLATAVGIFLLSCRVRSQDIGGSRRTKLYTAAEAARSFKS